MASEETAPAQGFIGKFAHESIRAAVETATGLITEAFGHLGITINAVVPTAR